MNISERNATNTPATAAESASESDSGSAASKLPITELTARPDPADIALALEQAPAPALDSTCDQSGTGSAEEITAGRVQAIEFAQKVCDEKHVDSKVPTP